MWKRKGEAAVKLVASRVSTIKTKAHEAGNLGNPTDEGSIPGSNFDSTPKCLRTLTLTLSLPS